VQSNNKLRCWILPTQLDLGRFTGGGSLSAVAVPFALAAGDLGYRCGFFCRST